MFWLSTARYVQGQIPLTGTASTQLSCLNAVGVVAKGHREVEGSGGMGSQKLGQFSPKGCCHSKVMRNHGAIAKTLLLRYGMDTSLEKSEHYRLTWALTECLIHDLGPFSSSFVSYGSVPLPQGNKLGNTASACDCSPVWSRWTGIIPFCPPLCIQCLAMPLAHDTC